MTPRELLRERRMEIELIAARHGARNLRVFGSVARNEAKPDRDIDLLIDTAPETSSWLPSGLILDLQDLLGRRVEIVTEKALRSEIRDRVLGEAVPL